MRQLQPRIKSPQHFILDLSNGIAAAIHSTI
jgi:hypothetical protein